MSQPDGLQTLWYGLLVVLWVGYFLLEGFDFGVGILVGLLRGSAAEKRAMIHTIGPLWDGNEVWLIVAGGATFAAFPGWYAAMFSSLYIPLLVILLALIVRGVAFEFWGKGESPRWRRGWELALGIASLVAPLLWGVAFADIVGGVPLGPHHQLSGSLLWLLHPYAILGGLATVLLCLAHGANFLLLRTEGALLERVRPLARTCSLAVPLPLLGYVAWTALDQTHGGVKVSATVLIALAGGLAVALPVAAFRGRGGVGFALSGGSLGLLVCALLVYLFPAALVSSHPRSHTLLLRAASSSHYTLTVMTVVAVVLLPVVLAYQAWTYWVFRYRLGKEQFEGTPTPLAVVERRHNPAGGARGG